MKLVERPDGFVLAVKVVPGSSRDRIAGIYGDGIKVTVTAAPEAGAANRAVIALLAEKLNIARDKVQITRGQANPRKEVLIRGLSAETIEHLLSGKN